MSTLRVNTIQDTAGSGSPAINGLARAWVNFNGTGTVAIRAALNVSSITDNGTGDYTVNFGAAMSDANYSAVCSGHQGNTSNVGRTTGAVVYNTTSVRVTSGYVSGSSVPDDMQFMNISVFR